MNHFHEEQQHEIQATIDEIHEPIDEVKWMDRRSV
jgi:archaellum component FlaC